MISSTPDGIGDILVDNYLSINGKVYGDYRNLFVEERPDVAKVRPGVDIGCPGPANPAIIGKPIEQVLYPVEPLDITSYIPEGTSQMEFALLDEGCIAGNTRLYLVKVKATPPVSKNYYPLAIGNSWSYDTKTVFMDYVSKGWIEKKIIGTKYMSLGTAFVGKAAYQYISEKPKYSYMQLWGRTPDGIVLYKAEGAVTPQCSSPVLVYKLPLLLGSRWTSSYQWESAGKQSSLVDQNEVVSINEIVITPAGTFSNCIKIKINSTFTYGDRISKMIVYQWLAPGIGLVKLEEEQTFPTTASSYKMSWILRHYKIQG